MRIPPPVIETVPLEKIVPWPKNPRTGHAVDAIAKSIERWGYLAPIIVQKGTYRILAGHGRFEALKQKGATEIPVLVASLTDQQADLYTLADNKLAEIAEWEQVLLGELVRDLKAVEADLTGTGLADEEVQQLVAGAESRVRELVDVDVLPPPKMTWVLIGLPTVRWGEIAPDVERIAAIKGSVVETTSNDG